MAKKSSDKARKEKKKKGRQKQCERFSLAITRVHATPATDRKGQKKKKKIQDVSKITYYSYNKKKHFISDRPEHKAKNKLSLWQLPRR